MKVVNINKALLIGIISLIVVNSCILIYHKYSEKETNIPKVKLKNQEKKKDTFAIMLEQDDGSYDVSSSNSFDQPGYEFNSEKSGCIDVDGNKIDNALSYNEITKSMIVNVNSTAYCYVYFDKEPNGAEVLVKSGKLWQSGLDGDGYRYTGTNPNNYICFGTTDKTTCIGNTDAYMYRIIGVFESGGTKYMKLIKKEALNTAYRWNDSSSDVDWGSSTLKSNLNGTLFLTNGTYMSSGWSDRIKNWTWNSVNTKTYESSGPDYRSITAKNVYLHENNKTGAPSGGIHGTTPDTKIGLMYVSDYLLALGTTESLEYNSSTNKADFKESWMHLSNNDSGAPSTYEWTISHYGYGEYQPYYAWLVCSDGSVDFFNTGYPNSVRPVFYLNSNQVIKSGTGSSSDPYLLS